MRRLFILLVFAILPTTLVAQSYPTSLNSYVNDFADIIDPETEARITDVLTEVRESQGIEFTVVTINQISDYGATDDVPAFSVGLFNEWGVGDAAKNNGVLMLVSLNDKEAFTALGSGYGRQYDDMMDLIFDQHMKDNFRAGRFAEGIETSVGATIQRITRQPGAMSGSTDVDFNTNQPSLWDRFSQWLSKWFGVIIFGMVFIFAVLHRAISDQMVRLRKCPVCGTRHLSRGRETVRAATRKQRGKQIIRTNCSNCDYQNETTRMTSRKSSSGSSGGGSFGGGSSSGGGGGGRW